MVRIYIKLCRYAVPVAIIQPSMIALVCLCVYACVCVCMCVSGVWFFVSE